MKRVTGVIVLVDFPDVPANVTKEQKDRWANIPDDGLMIWHVDDGGANDLFHFGNNAAFTGSSLPNSKW